MQNYYRNVRWDEWSNNTPSGENFTLNEITYLSKNLVSDDLSGYDGMTPVLANIRYKLENGINLNGYRYVNELRLLLVSPYWDYMLYMTKGNDEWYGIRLLNSGYYGNVKYIICDQFDGLIKYLSDMGWIK